MATQIGDDEAKNVGWKTSTHHLDRYKTVVARCPRCIAGIRAIHQPIPVDVSGSPVLLDNPACGQVSGLESRQPLSTQMSLSASIFVLLSLE